MRRVVVCAGLAALYVVAAEIGFSLAFGTKQVTAVWPPTGIAVAALVLWGYEVWPGIFIGALVGNALRSEPLWTAAWIAAGNTAAPLAARWLLSRVNFEASLQRARDVVALIVTGAAAMAISATNGTVALAIAGIVGWAGFATVWSLWWAGDAMGVILVAPLIFTVAGTALHRSGAGKLERAAFFACVIAVTWLSFVSTFPIRLSVYPLIVWAALRLSQRETAWAIGAITGIAVWGTVHQLGALGGGSEDQRLLSVLSFLVVLSSTGLLMTATTSERRSATSRLREAAETLQWAFLPRELPKRSGMHVDALYVAAESEALVGGDWYDAFELPDGSIVISIGDVAGHGVAAAVSAARLRQAIFTTAFDTSDPATILERVNRTLEGASEPIATALVAVFDRSLETLQYAGAGHPPPIVSFASAPTPILPYDGLPLGAAATVRATTRRLPIAGRCAIVFYTDGLTDFNRDLDGAERSLREAASRIARDSTRTPAAPALRESVMGPQTARDDVAIVVVRID